MSIPDYQSIMLPLLRGARDGKEHSVREMLEQLSGQFQLTDDEVRQRVPSGQQTTMHNRVSWARTYLKEAGLLEATRRGFFRITDRGRKVLDGNPQGINYTFLEQFPEFLAFRERKRDKESTPSGRSESAETPEEEIDSAYRQLRAGLAAELLQSISGCSPSFFERLVIDLLVRMGYGGTREDAGQAVGKSGDEGIDGIIKEDRLGLDVVYIQAKRWGQSVGRPEIQKFAGALQGQRARKGIFITTSTFTKEATEFVAAIESKIVLIDGGTLAGLMIDFGIGVSTVASYELKKIDGDYFAED